MSGRVILLLAWAGRPKTSFRKNSDSPFEPLDDQQAWKAGMLRISTREFGLSLGDRACLALAHIKNLSIITADKQWDKLKTDIKIIQLR